MRYYVTLDGEEHTLEVSRQPSGEHRVVVPGAPDAEPVEVAATPTRLGVVVSLGGRHVEVVFDAAPPEAIVQAGRRHFAVRIESERQRAARARQAPAGGAGVVKAPMPGRIVKLLVEVGDPVQQGTALLVMEAMKMQNELFASGAGKVASVRVQAGDAVERGAILMDIAPDGS